MTDKKERVREVNIITSPDFDKIQFITEDKKHHYEYSFDDKYTKIIFKNINKDTIKQIKAKKLLLRPIVIFDIYIKLDSLNVKKNNLLINGIKGLAVDYQVYTCLEIPTTEEEKLYELDIMKTAFQAMKDQTPVIQSDDDNIIYGLQLLNDLFACGGLR